MISTTQDGPLNANPGTLYYNSTGSSAAPAAVMRISIRYYSMNADETSRIYYHCAHHRYMSGYEGDEGYMVLSSEIEDEEHANNYYARDYYQSTATIPTQLIGLVM